MKFFLLNTLFLAIMLAGLQHDLVIECHLPFNFQGTVIDLETSGIDPEEANLVAAGFLTTDTARVYFNSSNSPEFHQLVTEHVKRAQGPLAAYSKRFEENWLGTDFDFELMVNQEPKYKLFRNLTDGFNRGEGINVPSWWKEYLDAGNPADREYWKRNIACHNLSCVLLENLLLFINAKEHWRVTTPSQLSLFTDKAAKHPNSLEVDQISIHDDQENGLLTFDPIVTPDVPLLPSNYDLAVTVNSSYRLPKPLVLDTAEKPLVTKNDVLDTELSHQEWRKRDNHVTKRFRSTYLIRGSKIEDLLLLEQ